MKPSKQPVLETSGGDFPLRDYRLRQGGREWSIWHASAVLTAADESLAVETRDNRLPYGVSLWPSAIALAHEIATRDASFRGRSVLELGAGVGLPGIVASTLGGLVTQTDRDELSLSLCRRNGERNGVASITYRVADWTAWVDPARYDWIIGSDILYGESLHPTLCEILTSNLAANGRVLLADPFRSAGFRLFEALEAEGWGVSFSRWDIGEEATPRPIGVFELIPASRDRDVTPLRSIKHEPPTAN